MRRRGGIIITGLALGGLACHTPAPHPMAGDAPGSADAAADALPAGSPVVSGRLFQLATRNAPPPSLQQETEIGLVPPEDVALSVVLLDDGTVLQPAVSDDGLFSFPRHRDDETYQLTARFGGSPFGITYESSAASPVIDTLQLGRVGAPAGAGTKVTLTLTNFDGSDTLQINSTGILSETPMGSGSAVGSGSALQFSLAWDSAQPLFGPVGLLDASQGDELVAVELTKQPQGTNGLFQEIRRAAVFTPTLVSGQTLQVGGPMTAPQTLLCTPLAVTPKELFEQLTANLGSAGTYGTPADQWFVFGTQGPGAGASSLARLVSYTDPTGALTDATFDLAYFDPLNSPQLVALLSVTATRTDLGSSFAEAALIAVPLAPQSCGTSLVTVTLPSAIPMSSIPTIGTAGASGRVPITWTTTGLPDYWIAVVWDVTNPAAFMEVAQIFTTTPATSVAASLFQPGEHYTIELFTETGIPTAVAGDFTQTAFPFSAAAVWSPAFTSDDL